MASQIERDLHEAYITMAGLAQIEGRDDVRRIYSDVASVLAVALAHIERCGCAGKTKSLTESQPENA